MNDINHNKTMPHDYFPYFDYLRFILATIVMLNHDHFFSNKVGLWSNAGNFSVQVFFALSGFLIGGILLKLNKSQLSRFFFNRAIRIWVPYYLSLMILLIVAFFHDDITRKWLEFVFYKATFVYNLFGPPQLASFKSFMPLEGTGNHFWSVNAEEQFYLLAPIFLVLFPKVIGKNILFWMLAVFLTFYFNVYSSIVLGVFLSILNEKKPLLFNHIRTKVIMLSVLIMATIGLYFMHITHYMLFAPIAAVCIVYLLSIKGQKQKIGEFLGGISYSFYLNHWIALIAGNVLVKKHILNEGMQRTLVSLFIAYAISIVIYMSIEKPLLSKRNQYYTQRAGIVTLVFAYVLVFSGVVLGFTYFDFSL